MTASRTPRISILLTLVAALAMAVALPASAQAKSKKQSSSKKEKKKKAHVPAVGVGDNGAPMFSDSRYRALGLTVARRIVPYDFYENPTQLAYMDAWMHGAQAAGVSPLISFEHSYTYPTKLPSVAEYSTALKFALQRYPNLKTISPWNEANHKSQPTVKNPKRAAQYYNITRKICKSCKIIAADLLDQKNLTPWLKKFNRYASKKPKSKIWGLHSYTDINHNKPWKKSSTKKFLKQVKGQVWLTEIGGIVAFNYTYGYNESRAAKVTTRALNLGLKSSRISRIYLYCWFGSLNPGEGEYPYRWDSGLVSPNGDLRPGYYALENWMKKHKRVKAKHKRVKAKHKH